WMAPRAARRYGTLPSTWPTATTAASAAQCRPGWLEATVTTNTSMLTSGSNAELTAMPKLSSSQVTGEHPPRTEKVKITHTVPGAIRPLVRVGQGRAQAPDGRTGARPALLDQLQVQPAGDAQLPD